MLAVKQERYVIGLMSGTSVDGIDAALVVIDENDLSLNVELKEFITLEYSSAMRQEILSCCDEKKGTVDKICSLNFSLAEIFTNAVYSLVERSGIQIEDIDLIGSHGQTIYHYIVDEEKESNTASNSIYNSTLQIGAAGVIAEKTGITTISNFRVRDIAAGGEGAPLVPYIDYLLYTHKYKNRVLQNIGGIGNYTYLPARAGLEDVVGTDTGPGNILIDLLINILSEGKFNYDRNGEWAAQGRVSEKLLGTLMELPFIKNFAPKTTGREVFGMEMAKEIIKDAYAFGLKKEDIISTVTAFTARSIVDAYNRFISGQIDQVVISGGGSYNPVLMGMIREEVAAIFSQEVEVITQEKLGFSSDAKEAVAFAVLAYQTMKGKSGNLKKVTGAKKRVVLGDITPGNKFFDYLIW